MDQHEPVPVTATSTNKIKWSSVSMDDDGMNPEDERPPMYFMDLKICASEEIDESGLVNHS